MTEYDHFAPITREAFARFLERHAQHRTGQIEWNHFIVRHYGDTFLEEIRRCVVRLMQNRLPIHGDTDAAIEMLHSWAFLLRSSTNASEGKIPDIATIDLSPAEAVVLFSVLRRYSESDVLTVGHVAEQQCLWNIECLLEKHGDNPLWPPLEEALDSLSPEQS